MSDEYRAAALKDPCFRFIHGIYAHLGNPPHEIERFKAQAATAREKAEGLTDRDWRKAYLGWCDYVDGQIEKSIRAHAEGPERSRRYWESERARTEKVNTLLAENPPH